MAAWQIQMSQSDLENAKKLLAETSVTNSFAGGGLDGRPKVARRGAASAAAGPPAAMTRDDEDSEDDTAQEVMKGYLNVAQRLRGLEGSVLTTHLVPQECTINLAAVAAATKYMDVAQATPDHAMGPPSVCVAMAVLTAILECQILKQNPLMADPLKYLQGLVDWIKGQPLVVAAEFLKYWRAKSAYSKDGAPEMVRHTFFINSWVNGPNGVLLPMNAIVSTLLIGLGSVAKMGPRPGRIQSVGSRTLWRKCFGGLGTGEPNR